MADGDLLSGQEYRPEDNIIAPFTQRMRDLEGAATQLGDDAVEVRPVDANASLVRTFDLSAIQAAYLGVVSKLPAKVSFDLPPLLISITALVDSSVGDGNTSVTGAAQCLGDSVSLALSPRVEGSGSAVIMPDLQILTYEPWTKNLDAYEVLLFFVDGTDHETLLYRISAEFTTLSSHIATVTIASPGVFTWNSHGLVNGDTVRFTTTGALPTGLGTTRVYYVVNKAANTFQVSLTPSGTAINTSGAQSGTHTAYFAVRPWPVWKPLPCIFTLKGENASIQTNAAVQQQVHISGTDVSVAYSEGTGITRQIGITQKTIIVPPTLHETINITWPPTVGADTATVTSRAQIHIPLGTEWPKRDADTGSITRVITATLNPSLAILATTPSGYPQSGLYLQNLDVGAHLYDMNRARAVVFDFAVL